MKPAFRLLALPLCLLPLGAVLLGGCGRQETPLPALQADIARQAQSYPAELAAARRMGLPVEMDDLGGAPVPPASQNAAQAYRRLGHMLRAYPLNNRELALEGLSTAPMPTPRALGFARAALAHRARYLIMIHQAAAMPICVFHHNWDTPDPESITFPEIDTFREASLLISGQSVVMAESGHPAQAVANASTGFRLAGQIEQEQILACYETACDIDFVTFTTLQKILYISHGDPKVAQAVQQAIAQNWHPRDLESALRRECAFDQGFVQFARKTGPGPLADAPSPSWKVLDLPGEKPGSKEWNRLMDANAAVLLSDSIQETAAAALPFPESRSVMQKIVVDSMKPIPSRLLPSLLVPNLTSFAALRSEDIARARITQAAAVVLSWKASHGAFPATLSAANTSPPLDPFSGKPLLYRKEGSGFVLYSIGPSGSFDGGSPRSEPSQAESLFRWPLPPYDFPAKPQPVSA